ncbi:MAG: AAA family ATPase [Helicobacteraceae bacterium]|jgi:predicted ATPase|nr:AAA family ATPase [Helicobacteraceae bacterium]
MKIRSFEIIKFRGLRDIKVSNVGKSLLVTGDNGSGKTRVLQALAFCYSMVTNINDELIIFDWSNFSRKLVDLGEVHIKIDIEMDIDEYNAVLEVNKIAFEKSRFGREYKQINELPTIHNEQTLITVELRENFDSFARMFMGLERNLRQYNKPLISGRNYLDQLFLERIIDNAQYERYSRDIGGIYWFDHDRDAPYLQQKKLDVISDSLYLKQKTLSPIYDNGKANWHNIVSAVVFLRNRLSEWFALTFRQPEYKERIKRVEDFFAKNFSEIHLLGPSPDKYGNTGDFFVRYKGENFELSELSGGELAMLKLAILAVDRLIYKSAVLIDEIELHLSEVEQKRLFINLPILFPSSQFIITSHSRYFADHFADNDLLVLVNGSKREINDR